MAISAISGTILTVVGTAASIYQQQSTAEDTAHAAQMQAEATAKYNAEMAAAQAAALDKQAQIDAEATQQAADRLKSTQKALIASGGSDVNAGSSTDLYTDTNKLAAQDIKNILSNAKTQGDLLKQQAAGQNTLLTQSAMDAAAQAYANANAATTSSLLSLAKTTTSNKDFLTAVKTWMG